MAGRYSTGNFSRATGTGFGNWLRNRIDILTSLAGHIQKYTGIDFSRHPLIRLPIRSSKGDKKYPLTDLKVCLAHEVELDKDEKVDTIILNSIVQYFPGEKYLSDVLEKSISMLKGRQDNNR